MKIFRQNFDEFILFFPSQMRRRSLKMPRVIILSFLLNNNNNRYSLVYTIIIVIFSCFTKTENIECIQNHMWHSQYRKRSSMTVTKDATYFYPQSSSFFLFISTTFNALWWWKIRVICYEGRWGIWYDLRNQAKSYDDNALNDV